MRWVAKCCHDDRMHPDEHQPYQYVPYPVAVGPPPTSGLATASLVFGLISIMGGTCLIFPPFLAVWFGHGATRETRTGKRGGHGMAVTGLILGYIGAVGWIVLALMMGIGMIGAGVQ